MDNVTERIAKVSIRSGANTSRSPASVSGGHRGKPSPASSDWAAGRGERNRQHRPSAAERGRSNPSMQSLDGGEEEEGGELAVGGESAAAEEKKTPPLTREQREAIRFSMVRRKKDFKHVERVDGRLINVLEGLELHTGVFSAAEQRRIVDCVYELQELGRNRQLRERTYSEPRKWMRGKGRVTLQFGCCYNYAVDKNGNPPGIIRDEEVDPIPPLLKMMIKRMVTWHVLPPTCAPNSCIINIYDKDDCIPPHIDHHDFVRPFCTVSFLSECNILFGRELKIIGPGEFAGSTAIPLPVGSVLILKGNGADVAKHCVPAVPSKRISITFRKMDDSKLPYRFSPDPELQNLQPLPYPPNRTEIKPIRSQASPVTPSREVQDAHAKDIQNSKGRGKQLEAIEQTQSHPTLFSQDDFPALGCKPTNGRRSKSTPLLRQ